jgi:hypothetical protein
MSVGACRFDVTETEITPDGPCYNPAGARPTSLFDCRRVALTL